MSTNNRTVISMDLVNEIMTGLQNAKPSNPVTLSIRNAVDFVKFDIKDALDRHLTWDDISAEFSQRGIICSSRTLQNYYSKVKPRVGREKAIPFSIHKVKENQQKRTAATLKSGRDDTTPSSDVIIGSRQYQNDVISRVKNGVETDIILTAKSASSPRSLIPHNGVPPYVDDAATGGHQIPHNDLIKADTDSQMAPKPQEILGEW